MPENDQRDPRSKIAHIEACLDPGVEYVKTTGFERFDFTHQALTEVQLSSIDLSLELMNKSLAAPLMIAPMTGGVGRGAEINRRLASAAERHGLAMGLGSVRIAIEDPSRADLFKVRDVAPSTMLFANVGAGQLCAGWGVAECRRAVAIVQADHLFIHLNPIQEAVQSGSLDFRGLFDRIVEVARTLAQDGIVVGVREVGFGLSSEVARRLIDAGIALLDCAGAGGTSWAKVEARCAEDPSGIALGRAFGEWGIPTADSLRAVRALSPHVHLVATGGLRTGIDVAKAIALGADLGAMARPFLVAAAESEQALEDFILHTLAELRIAMLGAGAGNLEDLRTKAEIKERIG